MSTKATGQYDSIRKALIVFEGDNIIVAFKSKKCDLFTWFFLKEGRKIRNWISAPHWVRGKLSRE